MIKISFEALVDTARLIVTEEMPYPLATVWVAQTEGLYVQKWWAPTDYENTEVDITTAVGGTWRVTQRDPEGNQYSFYGKVERAEPQALLEFTLTSEIYPDSVLHITQDFAARDGGTVVATTYEFANLDALNTYLALGGTERLSQASARLDALLTQLTE